MYVCDRLRACVFTSDLAAAVQTPFHSKKKKKAYLSAYVNSVAFEFKILNYCYRETNTDGTPAAVMCSVTLKTDLGLSQTQ